MALALGAWFLTQHLIGTREAPTTKIVDAVHDWTAPWHDWLWRHERSARALLIASSACIDLVGCSLLALSVCGASLRPFLALLILFSLRQACQGLCSLPAPDQMIWYDPGFPSLLVTYGVATDLFFSGHTGIAVLGATELARRGCRWLTLAGVLIAGFEALTVLVLRAHYTMDVFAGAVTALVSAGIAARVAPACDRALARLSRKTSATQDGT